MTAAETFRSLLDRAYEELAGGAGEAERWAKAVSALIRAERDLAEFLAAAPQSPEEDAEAIRAELRSRFRRFIAAEQAGASDAELVRIGAGSSS